MTPATHRVLVVHPRVKFINPTTELWPEMVSGAAEAVYFGPGYQPPEVLAAGLARFVDAQPVGFDCVLVSEHVTNTKGEDGSADRAAFLHRTYGYSLPDADAFLHQKVSWLRDVNRLALPTIYSFFEFDPYRVYPEWSERVANAPAYIMGWGTEFVRPLAELDDVGREPFSAKATDLWHHVLTAKRQMTLSLPAFVVTAEASGIPLDQRSYDWSVLGTNYALRREAREVLRSGGVKVAGARHHQRVAAVDKISRGRIGNRAVRSWMRRGFRRALLSSRASYTCGSGLEYPVRKFFEIPAAGAVLSSKYFPGLTALGFRHGINWVQSEPAEILNVSNELLGDDLMLAQQIALNGQNLVLSTHSLQARIQQFRLMLDLVIQGRFRGSKWHEGRLVLNVE